MADLNGFNANDYEPLGDFEAIPAGNYNAMATDSETKKTKAGTGSYLQVVWEIMDGPHAGRKLWSRLNLDNPNTKAVEIAKRELSSICRAIGVFNPGDSEELHNIPVVLKVGVEKRKDNGEMTNRIKGYDAMDGAVAAQPQPSNGAKGTAPWKR